MLVEDHLVQPRRISVSLHNAPLTKSFHKARLLCAAVFQQFELVVNKYSRYLCQVVSVENFSLEHQNCVNGEDACQKCDKQAT